MRSGAGPRIAGAIRSFVENPITLLVKGGLLILIGLSEASRTFRDDFARGHFSLGHGLILIGVFSVLDSLPHLIDGLDSGGKYLELRAKRREAKEGERA